jgi:hypothetical protein
VFQKKNGLFILFYSWRKKKIYNLDFSIVPIEKKAMLGVDMMI